MKTRYPVIALAAGSALFLAGCSSSTTTESATASPTMAATEATPSAPAETIVELAAANPEFSTLVTAVKKAGLAETLSGEGPFTVFAPTNEAFAAVPPKTLKKLLKPRNKEALTKVLTYHVVEGQVLSSDITAGKVPTVEGQDLTITTTDGVKVNGVTVVQADVVGSNGVIHAIDGVLIPPDVDPATL